MGNRRVTGLQYQTLQNMTIGLAPRNGASASRHGATTAALVVFAVLSIAGPAAAQQPAPSCSGATTVVARNDTLSSIAQRCNVSEASILAANPAVDGSGDLEIGTALHVRRREGLGERTGRTFDIFAAKTEDVLGRLAGQVGSSVQELLNKNPDLKDRLNDIGSRFGLSDGSDRPVVSVTPQSGRPGSTVTLAAINLPKSSPVRIGVGAPGSPHDVVQSTRTSPDGTLDLQVQIPAAAASQIVFVVKDAHGQVEARSKPFTVSE